MCKDKIEDEQPKATDFENEELDYVDAIVGDDFSYMSILSLLLFAAAVCGVTYIQYVFLTDETNSILSL